MADELAQFEFLNAAGLKKRREQNEYAAFENSIDWKWGSNRYNRVAIVNLIVKKWPDCDYLEIGCDKNVLFHALPIKKKTGVDPAHGGTHRMTSDKFFAENKKKYDVVFIDGLHTYEQAHKDAANGLKVLSENGWMAFHDFLPQTWSEQHVPRLQGVWTGDVWKLAFELAAAKGIEFKIVTIDHGVGVLRLTGEEIEFPDFNAHLSQAGFEYFYNHYRELPLIDWNEASEWIARPTKVT